MGATQQTRRSPPPANIEAMSAIKTTLLLGLLTGLLLAIGGIFGGEQGIVIAFIFAAVLNLGSYWFSASIVLRTSGAKSASEEES